MPIFIEAAAIPAVMLDATAPKEMQNEQAGRLNYRHKIGRLQLAEVDKRKIRTRNLGDDLQQRLAFDRARLKQARPGRLQVGVAISGMADQFPDALGHRAERPPQRLRRYRSGRQYS